MALRGLEWKLKRLIPAVKVNDRLRTRQHGGLRRANVFCWQHRNRSGFTLIEGLVVVLVVSFLIAATARLLDIGQKQQRFARGYSQVQRDLREALRRETRALRHGYTVVNGSTEAAFAGVTASNASQVIVLLPQATGVNPAQIQARYHLTSGTLYAQRADQAAPGTALITGVDSLSLAYFKTVNGARTSVTGTPQDATEVQIRLTAVRERVKTPVETLVTLRNKIAGL